MSVTRGVLLLFAALSGCSRLPSFAQPTGSLVQPGDVENHDLIAYRALTKADFKGSRPSGEAGQHTDAVGAQTHAIISPDAQPQILITGTQEANGDKHYVGKLEGGLHFRAQMDRTKSWWNPQASSAPEDYILEHEQTHFAIFEAQAHRLNARVPEFMKKLRAEGDTQAEVRDEIQKMFQEIMQDALEELTERNRDFDEDTSGTYEPKKQREWFRKVTSEFAP